jgi:hypothetical protein
MDKFNNTVEIGVPQEFRKNGVCQNVSSSITTLEYQIIYAKSISTVDTHLLTYNCLKII